MQRLYAARPAELDRVVSATNSTTRDPLTYFGAKGLLKNLRSSLVYGYTSISNFEFQPDDAYAETQRASVNLIWSPMERLDVGVEYLWGLRKNKDGRSGTANQLQIVVTFSF
jgi:hypothetical protein